MTANFDNSLRRSLALPTINYSGSVIPTAQTTSNNAGQLWAADIRKRIEETLVEYGTISLSQVNELNRELVSLFNAALDTDTRACWTDLKVTIRILLPFRGCLRENEEIWFLLSRLLAHLADQEERLSDLNVAPALAAIFPDNVRRLVDNHPRRAAQQPQQSLITPSPRLYEGPDLLPSSRNPAPDWFSDGQGRYLFRKDLSEEYGPKIKPVTLKCLTDALGDVVADAATRDSSFGHPLLHIVKALEVDFSEFEEKGPITIEEVTELTTKSNQGSSVVTGAPEKEEKPEKVSPPPMTGREAVLYFTKCYHLRRVKFMFFNIREGRYYDPYDLVAVRRDKVNADHYLFSTFGVLHITPYGPGEVLSLTDWQREAVLHRAITRITFFKNYLTMKMFHRWKSSIDNIRFKKTQKFLSEYLVPGIPIFGKSLLEISKLLQELGTIKLVPFDAPDMLTLTEFVNNVNYRSLQVDEIVEKFYSFVKLVVDETAAELYKRLQFCQEQVHQKPYFTKDSLHLQRLKKEEREASLERVRLETSQLGNFLRCVNLILTARLVDITLTNASSLVRGVMLPPYHEENAVNVRPALFTAALVFNDQSQLTISPSAAQFREAIESSIWGIPQLLLKHAFPMDGMLSSQHLHRLEQLLKEMHKTPRSEGESPRTARSIGQGRSGSPPPRRMRPAPKQLSTDVGAAGMAKPTPPFEHLPMKREDDLHVATPDLVQRDGVGNHQLQLTGKGFLAHYTPVQTSDLTRILNDNVHFKEVVELYKGLLDEGLEEVDSYCGDCGWLQEIYEHCSSWTGDALQKWKGAQAFAIEQKLNSIRSWTERLKGFDKTFVTMNELFLVDCQPLITDLLNKVNQSYRDLVGFVAKEVVRLSREFLKEMLEALRVLKERDTEMDKFAVFSNHVLSYRQKIPEYQKTAEYTKTLFEVIRMSYRSLSREEERLEGQVASTWDKLMVMIQDATEFYNEQMPIITRQLEEMFERPKGSKAEGAPGGAPVQNQVQKLEAEAREICAYLTSGKFLDPAQNPTELLEDISKKRQRLTSIQKELVSASKSREMITGKAHNLDFLHDINTQVEVRHDMWKYVELVALTIQDWKGSLFAKFNAKAVMEKLCEWLAATYSIKKRLQQDDDPVLKYLFKVIQDFQETLPLLHKLSSPALKTRHWKSIFLGFGVEFDSAWQFRVRDLLSYDLPGHSQIINAIYSGALAEYRLEETLNRIRNLWVEKEFHMGLHITEEVHAGGQAKERALNVRARTPVPARHKTGMERFQANREAQDRKQIKTVSNAGRDVYILIEVEEILHLLEDSRMALSSILASPFLHDLYNETKSWAETLREVEEIVALLRTAQEKWLFLERVFEKAALAARYPDETDTFEELNNKFLAIMQTIVEHPKVVGVSTHPHLSSEINRLHGTALRKELENLISSMDHLIVHLSKLFLSARRVCPRLFLLGDVELVPLLGSCRSPRGLTPLALRIFPGLQDLEFRLPPGVALTNTAIDMALNAARLEAGSLVGALGETVPLDTVVSANPLGPQWLSRLEHRIKTTMVKLVETCVRQRLETEKQGELHPLKILEELSQAVSGRPSARGESAKSPDGDATESIAQEIRDSYQQWLLRFPLQCVLLSERIVWNRAVSKALVARERGDLVRIRDQLRSKADQLILLLKDNFPRVLVSGTRERLHAVTQSLVLLTNEQILITEDLLSHKHLGETGYEWLRLLRHEMFIQNVPIAKADLEAPLTSRETSTLRATSSCSATPSMPQRSRTFVSPTLELGPVTVSQLGQTFTYDYEYYGPDRPLVLTPLTERAFLAMTMALKSRQVGALIGSSGTGKSETAQEMARLLGRFYWPVQCTNELSGDLIGRLLNGGLLCGALLLFENMQELSVSVMSHLSQELEYLKVALRAVDRNRRGQYDTRGARKSAGMTRRNSLPTLHPMTPQSTVDMTNDPIGSEDEHMTTHFQDAKQKTRDRRHSVNREIDNSEMEHYKGQPRTAPLFHELLLRKLNSEDYEKVAASTSPEYEPCLLGSILYNGVLFQPRDTFGCLATINVQSPRFKEIPDTLRALFRPCSMVTVEWAPLIEANMLINGISTIQSLTQKMLFFMDQIRLYLPQHVLCARDLRVIFKATNQRILSAPANQPIKTTSGVSSRHSSSSSLASMASSLVDDVAGWEEAALSGAIWSFITGQIGPEGTEEWTIARTALRAAFPLSSRLRSSTESKDAKLASAVKEGLVREGLQPLPDLVDKTLQLHGAIIAHRSIILAGPTGSGKSTAWRILSRALTELSSQLIDQTKGPRSAGDLENQENGPGMESVNGELLESMHTFMTERPVKFLQQMSSSRGSSRESSAHGTRPRSAATTVLSKTEQYPRVEVESIFTGSYSALELLGSFDESGVWQEGLLSSLVLKAAAEERAAKQHAHTGIGLGSGGPVTKWFVLDGGVQPSWSNQWTGSTLARALGEIGGRAIKLPESSNFLLEVDDLSQVSPDAVSRCGIVFFPQDLVPWKAIWDSWLDRARERFMLTNGGWNILADLAQETLGRGIDYILRRCTSALYSQADCPRSGYASAYAQQAVSQLVAILEAFLVRHFARDAWEKKAALAAQESSSPHKSARSGGGGASSSSVHCLSDNWTRIEDNTSLFFALLKAMYGFAFVWGLGGWIAREENGGMEDETETSFETFARTVLSTANQHVEMAEEGSVFDYLVDMRTGALVPWTERLVEKSSGNKKTFIRTTETERYTYLSDLLLSTDHPILLVGEPGVGKTSLVSACVAKTHPYKRLAFCPQLSAASLQSSITLHHADMQSKRAAVASPAKVAKARPRVLFFLDDLHLAKCDQAAGVQPTLELVRQILSCAGSHDRSRHVWEDLSAVRLLAACTPPGAAGSGPGRASHPPSPRLARLFTVLNMEAKNPQELTGVFNRMLQGWMQEFPAYSVDHISFYARVISQALVDLLTRLRVSLRPSPAQPHYQFTLHQVHSVVKGMLLMTPRLATKLQTSRLTMKVLQTNYNLLSTEDVQGKSLSSITSSQLTPHGAMTIPIARMWCHEVARVFLDRINNPNDRDWFTYCLEEVFHQNFCRIVQIIRPPSREPPKDEDPSGLKSDTGDRLKVSETPGVRFTKGDVKMATEDGDSRTDTSRQDEGDSSSGKVKISEDVGASPPLSGSEEEGEEEEDEERESAEGSEGEQSTVSIDHTSSAATERSGRSSVSSVSSFQRKSKRSSTAGYSLAETDAFCGPFFLSSDQVKLGAEELTDPLFTRNLLHYYEDLNGQNYEKTYIEANEKVLTECLINCLKSFNKSTEQRISLVFFKQAVCHTIRLIRVLSIPGGHALLLSTGHSVGRATLTRLAAYVTHGKVFEPEYAGPEHTCCLDNARQYMREAALFSGLFCRPAVLYLHDRFGEDALEDAGTMIREGVFPGMLEETDLGAIMTELGGVGASRRADKVDQIMGTFVQNVRENLHVIVCANFRQGDRSLHEALSRVPSLLTHTFTVDHYEPWTQETFVKVAHAWIAEETFGLPQIMPSLHEEEHRQALSQLIAYAHVTACEAINGVEVIAARRGTEAVDLFTPLTIQEVMCVCKFLGAEVSSRESTTLSRYSTALSKASDAQDEMDGYAHEIERLKPEYEQLLKSVEEQLAKVKDIKANYIAALDRCKDQEAVIANLREPLDKMKQEAQTEFNQINPIYYAALEAMKHLKKDDIEEIRTYNAPPQRVKDVVVTVCMLLDQEESWEAAKECMVREDFYEHIQFFDKEHITDEKFKKLGRRLNKPELDPEEMMTVSKAAAGLVRWLLAVHKYGSLCRHMNPQLGAVLGAEERVNVAQSKLGVMRIEAERIRHILEGAIEGHRRLKKKAKDMDRLIRDLNYRLTNAQSLMSTLGSHRDSWNTRLKTAKHRLDAAPVDSMFTALAVVYLSPMDEKTRTRLLDDWRNRLETGDYNPPRPQSFAMKRGSSDITSRIQGLYTPGFAVTTMVRTPELVGTREESRNSMNLEEVEEIDRDSSPGVKSVQETRIAPSKPLTLREDFSLVEFLGSDEEVSLWKLSNLPTDGHTVQSVLFLRTLVAASAIHWPIVHDPEGQVADHWLSEVVRIISREVVWMDPLSPTPTDEMSFTPVRVQEGGRKLSGRFPLRTEFRPTLTPDSTKNIPIPEDLRRTPSIHEEDEEHDVESVILEAGDAKLDAALLRAAARGHLVIVTRLDLVRRPSRVLACLLHRRTGVDEMGRRFVQTGTTLRILLHPNFRLMVTVGAPLLAQNPGLPYLTTHRLLTVDFGVGRQGLEERILRLVIKSERPEYEAQLVTLLKDVAQETRSIEREMTNVLERALTSEKTLLQTSGFLEDLIMCDTQVSRHQSSLLSSASTRRKLNDVTKPFRPIVSTARGLCMSLRSCGIELNMSEFLEMVEKAVRSCKIVDADRTTSQSAPSLSQSRARAQQLGDAITQTVLDSVIRTSLPGRWTREGCLLALCLERLREGGDATEREMDLLLRGVPEGLGGPLPDVGPLPDFVTEKDIMNSAALEAHVIELAGLTNSLFENAALWKEYFIFPLSFTSQPPGFSFRHKLSVVHKCLIWRVLCPDRFYEVVQALLTHVLGWLNPPVGHYSIKEVYNKSSPTRPVVCFVPAAATSWDQYRGTTFLAPLPALQQLAHELSPPVVHAVTLGGPEDPTLTTLLGPTGRLWEMASVGGWLILWIGQRGSWWDPDLVTALETLVEGRHGAEIHPDFRLFIAVETGDELMSLPLCLSKHAVKTSCALSSNMADTLSRYHSLSSRLVSRWGINASSPDHARLLARAVRWVCAVHTIMLHRQQFGAAGFTAPLPGVAHADLVAVLGPMRSVLLAAGKVDGLKEIAELVYAGHCAEAADARVVKHLIDRLWSIMEACNSETTENSILKEFFSASEDEVSGVIGKMKDAPSLAFLQLPNGSLRQKSVQDSRGIMSSLSSSTVLPAPLTFSKLDQVYSRLVTLTTALSHLASPNRPTPLVAVVHQESSQLHHSIRAIHSAMGALRRTVAGPGPLGEAVCEQIADNRTPSAWRALIPGPELLSDWLGGLERSRKWMESGHARQIVCLRDVPRPDRLFDVLLADYSSRHSKSRHKLVLKFEILPKDQIRLNSDSFYLLGLRAHGAVFDPLGGCLVPASQSREGGSLLPVVKVTVVEERGNSGKKTEVECHIVGNEWIERCALVVPDWAVQARLMLPGQLSSSVLLTCGSD